MEILCEEWGVTKGWQQYAESIWKGIGRVEVITDDSPERLEFKQKATESFKSHGICANRVKTWVNIMPPSDEKGYDEGYPHVHSNTDATTLVHYMDAGDLPPNLDILVDGEVVQTLTPQSGQTIYIPNGVWHGVHKNNGTRNRVAFIATAFPI